MKTVFCTFLLVAPALVHSFQAVPINRQSISSCKFGSSRSSTLCPQLQNHKYSRRDGTRVLMPASSSDGGLPLLPPADDSKRRDGGGHTGETTAEIGHVMPNRKMTLSFTCNICEGRSTYQINRVAFMQGIVVVWCQSCNQKHLIADNLGKMDFPEFGRNLEEYMAKKGTPVKRIVMSKEGLSHVEAEVPGADYPERAPNFSEKGFDGTGLLPNAHVGDAGLLPGIPPVGGVWEGEGAVEGDGEGIGSDTPDA